LTEDAGLVLLFPLPEPSLELLAAEVEPRETLLGEPSLDDVLRRDRRVVGSRLPERGPALHARAADQDVLDAVVQRVAEMERTRDVRGWDDDAKRVTGSSGRPPEVSLLLPEGVPAVLDAFGVVRLGKFVHDQSSEDLARVEGRLLAGYSRTERPRVMVHRATVATVTLPA
jgi:hypothetical protein